MGNAPGEEAEAFHFLRLLKLGLKVVSLYFGLLAIGDIGYDAYKSAQTAIGVLEPTPR